MQFTVSSSAAGHATALLGKGALSREEQAISSTPAGLLQAAASVSHENMGDAAEPGNDRQAHSFFKGVAKVPIDALKFDNELFIQQHRPVSEKIVTSLRDIFRREGCLRYDSSNWIDALVDPDHLQSVLARKGLTEEDLRADAERLEPLELSRVDCLQGLHRILAASDILDPNDRWWIVKLYSRGAVPPPFRRSLAATDPQRRAAERCLHQEHRAQSQRATLF